VEQAPEAPRTPALDVNSSPADNVPLGVVSNLIELQLFHLFRVRAIAAQVRAHRRVSAAAVTEQQAGKHTGLEHAAGSSSECSGGCNIGLGARCDELAPTDVIESVEVTEVVPVFAHCSSSSGSSSGSRHGRFQTIWHGLPGRPGLGCDLAGYTCRQHPSGCVSTVPVARPHSHWG
jgi:hypothetical protein